jgi:hypothetical protein
MTRKRLMKVSRLLVCMGIIVTALCLIALAQKAHAARFTLGLCPRCGGAKHPTVTMGQRCVIAPERLHLDV